MYYCLCGFILQAIQRIAYLSFPVVLIERIIFFYQIYFQYRKRNTNSYFRFLFFISTKDLYYGLFIWQIFSKIFFLLINNLFSGNNIPSWMLIHFLFSKPSKGYPICLFLLIQWKIMKLFIHSDIQFHQIYFKYRKRNTNSYFQFLFFISTKDLYNRQFIWLTSLEIFQNIFPSYK